MSGVYGVAGGGISPARRRACMDALAGGNAPYGELSGDAYAADCACGAALRREKHAARAAVQRAGDALAVIDAVIYNREELLPLTALPDDTPDEALLLHLLLARGPDALGQVNGDFAGAVYREKDGSLLLFRDHFGVRPLYVHEDGQFLAFSSDMLALLQMPGADCAVNEDMLYLRLMHFNTLSPDKTDFARVRSVKPGHSLAFTRTQTGYACRETAYYRPGQRRVRLHSHAAYARRMRELVADAVSRRAAAYDGLLGAELSGGMDSGVTNVLMHRLGREAEYLSWQVSPDVHPIQADDERLRIRDICRQEGITCHYLPEQSHSLADLLEHPLPPFLHTPEIGRTAAWMQAHGARVVFSGHGGDEGVSHRLNKYELWHHREYIAFAREVHHELSGRKLRLLRTAKAVAAQARRGRDYIRPWRGSGREQALLSPAFQARMRDVCPPALSFAYDPADYIRQGGPCPRLTNAAYQAAGHGVRYVFPLLDYRVMDYALGIPRRLYLHKGRQRMICREAFRDVLPASVCQCERKDSPGRASYQREGAQEDYVRSARVLLERLDRARWAAYINFDVVDAAAASLGEADCPLDVRQINNLYLCYLIQRIQERAKEWHEPDA